MFQRIYFKTNTIRLNNLAKLEADFIAKGGSYEKFKIDKLFDINVSKSIDEGKLTFNNNKNSINYVGRTAYNNGIKGKTSKLDFEYNKGNTISLSTVGTIIALYQKDPYYCSQNIYVLDLKDKELNEFIAKYLLSNINYILKQIYSGYTNLTKDSLKQHEILLPVNDNKEVDYEFIESYVKEVEKDRIDEIDTYLQHIGFDTYELTKEEEEVLNKFNNDSLKWEKFKIEKLFDVNGSKTTKKDLLFNNGLYPYITTKATDNGVEGYYDIWTEEGNCITVDSAVMGISFYQKYKFSASDHVEVLRLKDRELNELIASFMNTLLNKNIKFYGYNYGYKRNQTRLKEESILLPVNDNEEVDYEFIETFIKAIYKERLKFIYSWKQNISNQ